MTRHEMIEKILTETKARQELDHIWSESKSVLARANDNGIKPYLQIIVAVNDNFEIIPGSSIIGIQLGKDPK